MIAPDDTPYPVVDLARVERNIARMQAHADALGVDLRPHVKTHKLPRVALLQVGAGAVGVTCQKLGEAEAMADAGLEDLLISFPLVGASKLDRLVALAARARVTTCVDAAEPAASLAARLAGAGLELPALVDCDTGFGRTGVQSPQAAAELAAHVDALDGLRFAGFLTYPTPADGGRWLRDAAAAAAAAGLRVERVSGGGTVATVRARAAGGLTEMRPGTYVYGDRSHVLEGALAREDCALHVRATVVSRPTPERAILDAGSKALTTDPIEAPGAFDGHGEILELPDARLYALSEEHGHVDVSACARRPRVGEQVTILPNHACGVANLHDEVLLVRGDDVVGCERVAARGRSR